MNRPSPRVLGRLFGVAFVSASLACADYITEPDGDADREVRAIQVSTAQLDLADGESAQVTATLLDQSNRPFEELPADIEIAWSSADPTIVSVDDDGVATAHRPGVTSLTATAETALGPASARVVVIVRAVPTALEYVAGSAQTGTVGEMLPDSVSVRVIDRHGNPVAGVLVGFFADDDGALVPTSAETDELGLASSAWTLGPRPGAQSASATVPGLTPGRIVFDAVAVTGPLASVAITPAQATLSALGATVDFDAAAADRFGNAIADAPVVWTSLDSTVVTVDEAGVATAQSAGVGRVVATSGVHADTALVTVRQTVASVTVEPATLALLVGESATLSATARDANGHVVPNAELAWSSDDPSVTVSPAGVVTAVAPGSATISASGGAASGSAAVTVARRPASAVATVSGDDQTGAAATPFAPFVVEVRDDRGNPVPGVVVDWTIATGGGSLSSARTTTDEFGRAAVTWTAGPTAGPAQVVASVAGLADVAFDATIVAGPATSVVVSPDTLRFVSFGESGSLSAAAFDAHGNRLSDAAAAFTWSSDATGVATVAGNGASATVTARGNGTARISVRSGTATDTAIAVVRQRAARVSVEPATATVVAGDTTRFRASAFDALGALIADAVFVWSADPATVASVDQQGLARGLTPDTARISATHDGVTGGADLAVVPVPLGPPAQIVIVSGDDQTGAAGTPLGERLIVEVRDASGAPLSNAPVTWTITSGGGFVTAEPSTDANGRAGAMWTVGTAAGPATLDAAVPGVDTVTFSATIVPGPTASVVVEPDTLRFGAAGESDTLSAQAYDQYGNPIAPETAAFEWSTEDPAVASVTPSGATATVTAEGPGATRVIARSGDVADVAQILVDAAPPRDPYEDNNDVAFDIDGARAGALDDYDGAPGLPFRSVNDERGTAEIVTVEDTDRFIFRMGTGYRSITLTVTNASDRDVLDATLTWFGAGEQRARSLTVPARSTRTFQLNLSDAAEIAFRSTGATAPVPYQFEIAQSDGSVPGTEDYLFGATPLEPNDFTTMPGANFPADTAYDVIGARAPAGSTSVDLDFYPLGTLMRDVTVHLDNRDPSSTLTAIVFRGNAPIDDTRFDLTNGASGSFEFTVPGDGAPYYVAIVDGTLYDLCVTNAFEDCRTAAFTANGGEQIVAPGQRPAEPIVVTVWGDVRRFSESSGVANPQAGVLVKWMTSGGTVDAAEAVSDANGQVVIPFTAPDAAGPVTIRVWVTGSRPFRSFDSDTLDIELLVSPTIAGRTIVDAAAGEDHSCALDSEGIVFCWGGNGWGQTGTGVDWNNIDRPAQIATSLRFTSIEASDYLTTCGIATDARLFCWGYNGSGNLGDGSGEDSNVPVEVAGRHQWIAVAPGNWQTCGVRTDGRAMCWGENNWGQLGNGTTTHSTTPVLVSPADGDTPLQFTAITSGVYHACGIARSGQAYCWGVNDSGQLGHTSTETCANFWGDLLPCTKTPRAVSLDGTVTAIAAGGWHTCATAGATNCFGYNGDGELGDGTTTWSSIPHPVVGAGAYSPLAAGTYFTLGNRDVGWAWGANGRGELGNGDESGDPQLQPVRILVSGAFSALSGGLEHACGATTTGELYCWGANADGQLAVDNNDVFSSSTPIRVN